VPVDLISWTAQLIFIIQTFTCRPNATIPVKRQILRHPRILRQGQQMKTKIFAAETYAY